MREEYWAQRRRERTAEIWGNRKLSGGWTRVRGVKRQCLHCALTKQLYWYTNEAGTTHVQACSAHCRDRMLDGDYIREVPA